MSKLSLTTNQESILQLIYNDLEDAYYYGVDANSSDLNLGTSTSYDDDRLMGSAPGITAAQMRATTKQSIIRYLAPAVKRITSTAIGSGTVTSLSIVTANGISGTVATPTTTPAVTLLLGDITPTSIVSSGDVTGTNLSGTNSGDVSIGAFGSSPSADAATVSGQVITFQPADATHPGALTTGTQSIAGAKTFVTHPLTLDLNNNGDTGIVVSNGSSGILAREYFSMAGPGGRYSALINYPIGWAAFASFADSALFQTNKSGGWIFDADSPVSGTQLGFRWFKDSTTLMMSLNYTTGAFVNVGTVAGSNLSGTNTGDVTIGSFGASPTANAATIAGQVITLQPADATHPGAVTTGTQTLAGVKTFSSAVNSSVASGSDSVKILDGSRINLSTGDASAYLARSAANVINTPGKLTATTGLGVGNSAAGTTLGTVVKKMEVFDASGASLGFIAIYDAIT